MIIAPGMYGVYIISAIFMLIGLAVSYQLKSRMSKYGKMGTSSGMSGKDIAIKMLHDFGIYDVKVVPGKGILTDHYNPRTKTVSLSESTYSKRSVAAAAIAAHEVGHAVQHATGYAWLQFRSSIVPVVQISGYLSQFILILGIIMVNTFPQLLLAGIILFAATTVFTLVTLPVEFDASKRALAWLDSSRVTYGAEHKAARDGLRWAALTYVVAAVQAVITLLYYLSIFLNSRD